MKRHPNARTWFRFHAQDLSVLEWISFRLHAARCASCGARLRREIDARAGVEELLDARRPARARPSNPWLPAVLVGAVAAVGFFLVARPRNPVVEEDFRAKGGSTFLVYVAVDAGTDFLGETCKPGDALQAQYRSEKPYLIVVGVDPANRTRALFPLDGASSTGIDRTRLQNVPNSWVLDDAPGRERFVAFFSDAPVDAARAMAAAKTDEPALSGAVTVVRQCTKASP